MRSPAQQRAIETAVRRKLQTEDGRHHYRQHLKALPPGPSRRRLFERITEAEIVHGEGG